MDNKKETLDRLDEIVQILEGLNISFLVGVDKANAEYAINEAIIDIQEIENMIDDED